MAPPLHYWSLTNLSGALRRRELSSVEVTSALLDRITALEPQTRSYVTVMTEPAMAQACAADEEIARGDWRGPLHGVPIALKDLCFTKNAPTTAGMTILKDWTPDYDATVVERLNAAGAVTLGKLKMTEGAVGSHHPDIPVPRNPWNSDYWTGVSSSGSGVATAAGLCFGSLGSDTGGSIRFPSSACGLTGIKPTWGRVSRHGIFTLADSLDHIGPMARSAADAAAILSVIAGDDPNDPSSLTAPVPNYLAGLEGGVRGLRIGVDDAYNGDGTDGEITSALDEARRVLSSLGVEFRPAEFPSLRQTAVAACMAAMGAEMAAAHRNYFPARASEYGPELAGMIALGRKLPPIDIADAARLRRNFCGQLERLWADIDLLLAPTIPMTVPTVKTMALKRHDPVYMGELVRFTMPFDLTGSPTITLPCGFSTDGLPLAFQLVGPHLSEDLLCRAGHAFQQATDWHERHPDLNLK
jgi:amidase